MVRGPRLARETVDLSTAAMPLLGQRDTSRLGAGGLFAVIQVVAAFSDRTGACGLQLGRSPNSEE